MTDKALAGEVLMEILIFSCIGGCVLLAFYALGFMLYQYYKDMHK